MTAGFSKKSGLLGAVLCTLFALAFCSSAKAQAVQAQTGSSGQSEAPAPPQAQPEKKPANQTQAQPSKKKSAKKQPPTQQKKIKAHVVRQKSNKNTAQDTTQSAEPDKVLYERALQSIQKGRFTEGRLNLQTLINTYPDSEYLAKAKLAVADSYYKEGGTSNLTQAIEEYKNFIIFFPFLDEASYAQMQIGMGHFRMMEKSDRDTTQAQEAEQEFQTFLLKYPQSPLVPKAEQDLRDVQEVLADGEYKIARFYYIKQDYPAATARLIEVAERYPLYSQSDETLWMLGDVYSRAKQASKNEDDKNHWADLAAKCYDRIVQDYPLSPLATGAKARLKAMGMSVPNADAQAVARMKQEQLYEKQHRQTSLLRLPTGMLKSGPPLDAAARAGTPNLNPPDDAISAREVLVQGAKGPDFDQPNSPAENAGQTNGGEEGDAVKEAVPAPQGSAPAGTSVGVQIITPPPDPTAQPASQPAANSSAPPAGASGSTSPVNTISGDPGAPGGGSATPAAVEGGTASPDPAAINKPGATPTPNPNGQANTGSAAQNSSSGNGQNQQADAKPAKAAKADPHSESTSKKKKGLKKIVPW